MYVRLSLFVSIYSIRTHQNERQMARLRQKFNTGSDQKEGARNELMSTRQKTSNNESAS